MNKKRLSLVKIKVLLDYSIRDDNRIKLQLLRFPVLNRL